MTCVRCKQVTWLSNNKLEYLLTLKLCINDGSGSVFLFQHSVLRSVITSSWEFIKMSGVSKDCNFSDDDLHRRSTQLTPGVHPLTHNLPLLHHHHHPLPHHHPISPHTHTLVPWISLALEDGNLYTYFSLHLHPHSRTWHDKHVTQRQPNTFSRKPFNQSTKTLVASVTVFVHQNYLHGSSGDKTWGLMGRAQWCPLTPHK